MSTAEIVEKLDSKWPHWDLWRSSLGMWVVNLKGEKTFSSETIEGVLAEACEYVPLPEIPREPRLPAPFDVVKSGSKWCLMQNGHHYCGNLPTKKEAKAIAERIHADAVKSRTEWIRQHLHYVETHTEGVDFRWAS